MTGPSIFSFFQSFIPGLRLLDGGDALSLAKFTMGSQAGLTALAGGGATSAVAILPGLNEFSVVATTNDSAILPPAVAGLTCRVINDGAQTLAIYPNQANPNNAASAGDQITPHNSVTPNAAGADVTLPTAEVSDFLCFTNGKWKQTLLT